MRLIRALMPVAGIVFALDARLCADEFPYQAFLNADDVYVRSGPGKDYYPTGKLKRGEPIEVWRHDPGDWYAIRPPAESFSWVNGKYLRLLDKNLAEVSEDKVTAYVGSRFSEVHDVRQVQLDEGESVEIVGEKRFVSPEKGVAETWYKIAPPAGEFRWVYGRYLNRTGIPATKAEHIGSHVPKAPRRKPDWTVRRRLAEQLAADVERSDQGGFRVELAVAESSADGENVRILEPGAGRSDVQLATYETEIDERISSATPHARSPRRLKPNGDAEFTEMDQLDLDLSLLIAEPPATWQFVEIRQRAQQRLDTAASALERGRARAMLRDIQRYDLLKEDYVAASNVRNETNQQNQLVGASAPPATLAPTTETTASANSFDGIGRLTPVVSRRVGAPQFALTNPSGDVLMFITPAAGVNMQAYVGKVVGLTGTRGFMPQLKKAHLTASRVEDLSSPTQVARRPGGN